MKLAIIGGSLLKQINGLSNVSEEILTTPFGSPSDKFTSGNVDGVDVVYFNRHGVPHHIAPHQINYKANMFALKILEVTHVLAVTAVGGISVNMSPMKWVVPDQIIDYTYGRMQTYNDIDDDHVHHIDFSYPFDEILCEEVISVLETESCDFEPRGTYGATQGPRLETVAEIKRMQRDGCDIVGMTAMPEASLARELDISYAQMSLVVNWAAGAGPLPDVIVGQQQRHEIISMEEIGNRIAEGNAMADRLVKNLISRFGPDTV